MNQSYYQINYEATQKLVEISQKNKSRFVFISSRVAGENSGAYGNSKLLAEKYIQKNCENWLIIRPSEIFGVSKNEGIESLIEDAAKKKVLPYPIGVESKLYPIHVDDVNKIMHDHIFQIQSRNQIVAINGQKGYLYKEVIETVANACSNRPLLIPIPKLFVQTIGFVLKVFRIKTADIVPDQIPRLYSEKDYPKPNNQKSMSLEKYALQKRVH